MPATLPNLLRDERGVALPLALLGLVSVSLLVTTALVTSSTELAISGAHQDATAALYTAEGGLQAYVAQNGTTLQNDAGGGEFDYSPPGGGPEVSLSVTHLGTQTVPGNSIVRLYAVTAQPAAGSGRTLSAMVTQVIPPPVPLSTNITSALTVGGNIDVNGNSFDISGRSLDPSCGGGVEAVRAAAGAEIMVNNESHISGFIGTNDAGASVTGRSAIVQTTMTREELALDVLSGATLDELIASIPDTHKWGPAFTPAGQPTRVFDGDVSATEKVAVVDANGGTVLLRSGSGVVIVLNGRVEMSGLTDFSGIVIAEQSFWLHGSVEFSGALISLSYDATSQIELNDDDQEVDGSVDVQYDRCAINNAASGWGQLTQQTLTPVMQPTVSWLEVVR